MSEQTKNLLGGNYNPDVLECLANLSNDEVFTPPKVVNQMLDMFPSETWSNPNLKFLDPACKTGVFLREIAKRLIVGLEEQIPDLQQRLDHIFHNQLYGIAITELTALASRRSLYCSKYANGKYSVSKFDNPDGNIRFVPINHTWENGKCKYCGANTKQYLRDNDLETHAYEFIHTNNPEEIFGMKFDVIIGNPPYHLSDGSGGSSDSAMPIYNKFIVNGIKMKPSFFSMIIPSKWMVGGRGLNKFRSLMYDDKHISAIVDYEDSGICFPGVHLDGGVCYFLWDRTHNGAVEYTYIPQDGDITKEIRELQNDYFEYVVRDNRILSLIEKTKSKNAFSKIVSNVRPYGIRGYLFNEPNRYPDSNLSEEQFANSIKIYGVKGIKGGARRKTGYIDEGFALSTCRRSNPENYESVNKYKIFFTTSYSTNAKIPPEPILAGPREICTETFLLVGPFDDKLTRDNCYSYMKTKFFRTLLYFGKGTMHVNQSVFGLIPLEDFSKPWTDEELYKKYNLSEEEIKFIEENIAPMEDK